MPPFMSSPSSSRPLRIFKPESRNAKVLRPLVHRARKLTLPNLSDLTLRHHMDRLLRHVVAVPVGIHNTLDQHVCAAVTLARPLERHRCGVYWAAQRLGDGAEILVQRGAIGITLDLGEIGVKRYVEAVTGGLSVVCSERGERGEEAD